MTYGPNLVWILRELSTAESEQIEGGEFEVYGEDDQGREGSCTIEIPELAGAAANRIDTLEQQVALLRAFIEDTAIPAFTLAAHDYPQQVGPKHHLTDAQALLRQTQPITA